MDQVWFNAPAVPVIVAVVALVRQVGFPARFAGLLAVVLGIAGALAAQGAGGLDAAVGEAGFGGLIAGLAAAGLWSTGKAAAGK